MNSHPYAHILGFALEHPWAITRPMLSVIQDILLRRVEGGSADPAEINAALVNRKNLPQPMAGSVAIIPVYGVLAPRMNMLTEISGGTTFEKLTAQLRESVANKSVKTILLDVDSPGGNIAGMTEFAREIMRARTKKPVVAQAQYLMGSAAFVISSAATEIIAAPSAKVGALGVYTFHDNNTEALAKLGIKRTMIGAGTGKTDGAEGTALSEEGLARIQTIVDDAYASAIDTVVKGRGQGMSAEKARNDWKAHIYSAQEALSNGMIDRIATLDETLTRILTASNDPADQKAALTLSHLQATDQERPVMGATSQELVGEFAPLERAVFELVTNSSLTKD